MSWMLGSSSLRTRTRSSSLRIVANTQTSMGATGYTTGLAPSMSLGCGAYAGNITSDNITPLHLINIKRLAYERPRGGSAGSSLTGRSTAAATKAKWVGVVSSTVSYAMG